MNDKFKINEFVAKCKNFNGDLEDKKNITQNDKHFEEIVKIVETELDKIDNEEIREENTLSRRRNAILGFPSDAEYYRTKIKEILNLKNLNREKYPSWYKSLDDAMYHEILGFYGIEAWLNDAKYKHSDACMIIADNIFFEVNGEPEIQPQTISSEKRDRLKETLMLTNPKEPRAEAKHELYSGGRRVTIFNDNGVTKEGRDTIIFRKYHVNKFSFEMQAKKGTIPYEAIPMFKSMVKIGYNVAFTGPVKSAKTTFLTTWQSYENPKYTGLSIETDPEIPFHELMPTAPIIQFVPNDKNMDTVIERAKRSDAKYIVIGEARNGKMLNIAIEAANMGTKRSKVSFHNTETVDFCYDVAEKITREIGGSLLAYMIKTAKTFHYVINMWQLPGEENKKRLKGIWEIRLDTENMQIIMNQICRYVQDTDSWVWSYDIGEKQREIAKEESKESYVVFTKTLQELAKKCPDNEKHLHIEPYMKILLRGGNL